MWAVQRVLVDRLYDSKACWQKTSWFTVCWHYSASRDARWVFIVGGKKRPGWPLWWDHRA